MDGGGAAVSVLTINCELHTFILGGGSSVLGKNRQGKKVTGVTDMEEAWGKLCKNAPS